MENTGRTATALFLWLVLAYHLNLSVIEEGDAKANALLPVTLLVNGTLSYTAEEFPECFSWIVVTHDPDRPRVTAIHTWDQIYDGKSFNEWREMGHLRLRRPAYFLVRSDKQNTYVNTYGPVTGLTLLPLLAPLLAANPDLQHEQRLILSAAKLYASLLVAGSAVFLFLIGLRLIGYRGALFLALVYGLCTCVWSISSQNAWQQTLNLFLLSAGCYLLVETERGQRPGLMAGLCGFVLGAAVACRSTSLLLAAPIFLYLLIYHRRPALLFVLCGWPLPAAIGWYNHHFFDSPFTFGQSIVGELLAIDKTGSPDMWQTPLWYGAAAQLISPSRGLLVYSPFLLFSAWGAFAVWRDPTCRPLRPLTLGVVLVAFTQFKWFDYWGGWAYGYRPLVDLAPLLCLFLLPVLRPIWRSRVLQAIFAALIMWSFCVQVIGAFSYDKAGWNERMLHAVLLTGWERRMVLTREEAMELIEEKGGKYLGVHYCNMDYPFCRHRLWSVRDTQIGYYATHFLEARAKRLDPGWDQLLLPSTRLTALDEPR